MNNGWITLHRKIEEKGYYKDSQYIHLWVHILLKANHKEKEFLFNNQIQKVKRGSFITGRKQLSLETGISESKIDRILKCFESEQQIEQQMNSKFRTITILNYNTYQSSEQQNEQQVNIQRTASEQQVNTTNNVTMKTMKTMKNNEKEKKKKYLDFVFLYEEEYNKLIERYGETKTKEYIKNLDDYIAIHGKKYKDHYRVILKWNENKTPEVSKYQKDYDTLGYDRFKFHYMNDSEARAWLKTKEINTKQNV